MFEPAIIILVLLANRSFCAAAGLLCILHYEP